MTFRLRFLTFYVNPSRTVRFRDDILGSEVGKVSPAKSGKRREHEQVTCMS